MPGSLRILAPGLAASAVLPLLLAACASTGGHMADRPTPGDPGVVTREEIQASGARTVWEALRLTVALHVEDDLAGNPARLRHRGYNSILGPETPLLVVDGAIVRDYRHLDEVPARDLVSIHVRSPSYAAARYGSLARAGVVELNTRTD